MSDEPSQVNSNPGEPTPAGKPPTLKPPLTSEAVGRKLITFIGQKKLMRIRYDLAKQAVILSFAPNAPEQLGEKAWRLTMGDES